MTCNMKALRLRPVHGKSANRSASTPLTVWGRFDFGTRSEAIDGTAYPRSNSRFRSQQVTAP